MVVPSVWPWRWLAALAALLCLSCWGPPVAPLQPSLVQFAPPAPFQAVTPPSRILVQRSRERSVEKGKLLVASERLRDPNFAETVVLLIEYGEKGAMGVILNRASHIKLSELLPRVEGLEQRGDTIYEGGPVERSEILMLVRAAEAPENSSAVFGDVYLSASADLLKRLAAESPAEGAPFRVYSGYAGWAAGQLEAEVGLGAWHIFPATSAAVFTPRPEDLWRELIGRTTLRLAQAVSPLHKGVPTARMHWGFSRFPLHS